MVTAVTGVNLPANGFLQECGKLGYETVPLLWASATPSAEVTEEAFEHICSWMLDLLRSAGPVDAVYLDLHGAMVCTHLDDGEGELLRRVRALIGEQVPLIASLDFHANVTDRMMEQSTALVCYRTYPHVDMEETGRRAAQLCRQILERGSRPIYKSIAKFSYLIPLAWQSTLTDPMRRLIDASEECEYLDDQVISVSLAAGFALADIPECGPAVIAYAETQEAADEAVAILARLGAEAEFEFAGALYSPDEAVALAMSMPGPVVLADTQDNPGAGGTSDTVGLLHSLIEGQAKNAVLAALYDPLVASAAHEAGEGAEIEVSIGANSGNPKETPVKALFHVKALGNGQFIGTGPFYLGCKMDLGLMALLEHKGVEVVVSSRRQQAADQAILRHLGIKPEQKQILALKSSVHFRADFGPLAAHIMLVESPGMNVANPRALPYKRLRAGLRIGPDEAALESRN